MASTVHFQSVLQNPGNTVTIDLSPLQSKRSWFTQRNIVIGGTLCIGIATIVGIAASYFVDSCSNEEIFICKTGPDIYSACSNRLPSLINQVTEDYSTCEDAFNNTFSKNYAPDKDKKLCDFVYGFRDLFDDCSGKAQSCAQTLNSSCNALRDMAQRCLEHIPYIQKKRDENGTIYCSHKISIPEINLQNSEELQLLPNYEY